MRWLGGHENRIGRQVARLLEGAWRALPPPLDLEERDLDAVVAPLRRTQEAGLVWRRLPAALARTPAAAQLAATLRHVRLRNAVIEHEIPRVLKGFQAYGVDALLVKGWSVARLYPERGLRPFGDVDLCIRARDEAAAVAALASMAPLGMAVDLHVALTNEQGVRLLEDDEEDVRARATRVPLGLGHVQVLGWEDQLRLVCLHMWRHGAFRPLWLCDVAALVEALPADFDWDRCLGRGYPRADWVACAVGLAGRLLGARVPTCRATAGPRWLETAVLRQWSEFGEAPPRPLAACLNHPRALYHKLRWRWLNPLWNAHDWHAPLARLPRWGYSMRELLTPGSRLVRTVPELEGCVV